MGITKPRLYAVGQGELVEVNVESHDSDFICRSVRYKRS